MRAKKEMFYLTSTTSFLRNFKSLFANLKRKKLKFLKKKKKMLNPIGQINERIVR